MVRQSANPTDADLTYYEGLIYKTSQMLAAVTELEADDIAQLLRIKAWKALNAFDPSRCRTTRRKYVFMCIKDQGKDVLKKKRRGELYIEDLAQTETDKGSLQLRDSFDERYLSSSHDSVYGTVDEDDVLIPSTVTRFEKRVLLLLYTGDYKQGEIASRLRAEKREVEKAIRSLRIKFSDWAPGPDEARELQRAA